MDGKLEHMSAVQTSMQFGGAQVTPAMMEAAKLMAEQMLPWMMNQMPGVEDIAWVKVISHATLRCVVLCYAILPWMMNQMPGVEDIARVKIVKLKLCVVR
jgi:hypothetical protein